MTARMPALFLGHGNPLNALQDNPWTRAWRRLGEEIPAPHAILAVSAHWYVPFTAVTIHDLPPTIHDFHGFPGELNNVQYPAPGDPALARRVQLLLGPVPVRLEDSWGLDHGTWSVLRHAYPRADVPVVQLAIDATKPAPFHYELGRKLAPLRDEGILILGSGNIVHNLRLYAWGRYETGPFDWAVRFEERARALMEKGDIPPLLDYEALGPDARLSIPTPDHYLPLLYVLGARQEGDSLDFPMEGVEGGSISMLAVRIRRAV